MRFFYRVYIFLALIFIVIIFGVTLQQDANVSDRIRPIPPVPEEIDSIFTLYFAKNGKLVEENREVATKDMIFERVIVDELMKGPRNTTFAATIPQNSKLISIETIDEICYVNFSKEYIEGIEWEELGEEIIIWSLVNSLTHLEYIQKVQIFVEGETIEFSHRKFSINQPFTRNEDIIQKRDVTHYYILKDFLDSLNLERYEKAYIMLDKGSKARISFQEFTELMPIYIKQLRDYEIGLHITQKYSDRVVITLKYIKGTADEQIGFYQEWKLIQEEGEIKIVLGNIEDYNRMEED